MEVAEQPEAGDVGHRVDAGGERGRRRVAVERRHRRDRGLERRAAAALASPPSTAPRAQRLAQHQHVARARRRRCAARRSGCTIPMTASPYIGSASSIEWPPATGMPAASRTPRRRRAGSPPARRRRSAPSGKRDQSQRHDRRAAHRVDVRQRVGRAIRPKSNGSSTIGVKKSVGGHQRQLVVSRNTPASSAGRSRPAARGSAPAPAAGREQRRDRRGGQLAAAAGAVGERGQRYGHATYDAPACLSRPYSDAELDAAIAAISDPARLAAAQYARHPRCALAAAGAGQRR